MKLELISSITMFVLAAIAVTPMLKVESAPRTAGKLIGWIWMFFATIPLQYEIVFRMFEEGGGFTSTVVFGIIALVVAAPAFFLARHPEKGSAPIFSLAWGGVGVFGVTFLFFGLGTPILLIKAGAGSVPFDVVSGGALITVWTGSALCICAVTIKILKSLKTNDDASRRKIHSDLKSKPNSRISRTSGRPLSERHSKTVAKLGNVSKS
jgi:hypothetical protein